MPAALSAGRRPWSAQSLDMRFNSHNVAGSRNGLSGCARLSMAFDAAGSLMKASVSSGEPAVGERQLRRLRTRRQIRHRRRHVQPPRNPRERGRPRERIVLHAELAPQPLVERRLLSSGAGAQRFEIAAILPVVAARDVDQDVERRGGGLVAHRQRHLAPDAGVRVAGEPRGHRHDVETRAPHRAVGGDAQRRIGERLGRARALRPSGPS